MLHRRPGSVEERDGQLITVYITQVCYSYLDSFERWLGRRLRRQPAESYIPETACGR